MDQSKPLKPLTIEHLASLPIEPAPGAVMSATMLDAAEQALIRHKRKTEADEAFSRALRVFRARPTRTVFAMLIMAWKESCATDYDVFEFIAETLRSGGLPRDGPFVWTSPEDPTDTEDMETPQMATRSILTPPGVASFLNLKEARAVVTGGEPRYSLTIIFDKAAQARQEFKNLQIGIDEALKQKWPARLPTGIKSPFHDAGEKAGQYDGYKSGDIFISPWSKDQPGCINARKEDIIDWSEFYAGWLVRANVRPFAYDQGGNKGCSFFLDSVQFLKPGKRLDGRKAANESFPDDGEGDDGEEMV